MADTPVPAPPFAVSLLSGGVIAPAWQSWLLAVWNRLGGQTDKVEAAYATAAAAAPATSEVVASGGLQQGGQIGGNVGVALYVAMTDVASLPTEGVGVGDWAFALDGQTVGEGSGAGTGAPAFYAGGGWNIVDSGGAASISSLSTSATTGVGSLSTALSTTNSVVSSLSTSVSTGTFTYVTASDPETGSDAPLNCFQPNLAVGQGTYIQFGIQSDNYTNSGYMSFNNVGGLNSPENSITFGVNSGDGITVSSEDGLVVPGPLTAQTSVATPALTVNGQTVSPILSGTSGSIGGSALSAGAAATGTVTVAGATTGMAVVVSTAGADPGNGFSVRGYVSAANTVTVVVTAIQAGTPTATTYNVRVIP